MSLEVFGDEGDIGPEGYMTDEVAGEMAAEAFERGAQMMREMLARFVASGGDETIAGSIRANWNPVWGNDPGQPEDEKYDEAHARPYVCWNW